MNNDIDKILNEAYRKSKNKEKILGFLVYFVLGSLILSLFWTCSYGPLTTDFSDINHGDKVKVTSGTYRGVIGKVSDTCPLPWHFMVQGYCCKPWWELEKIQ